METKFKEQNIGKVYLDENKERYIQIEKCGISPVILLSSNIELTNFGNEKQIYIRIQAIIDWYKDEIKENETCGIDYMNQLKANLKFLEDLLVKDLVMN